MRLSRRQVLWGGAALPAAATLAAYAALRPPGLRNFGAVRAGVLYRSGQLTPAGLGRVLAEYRCRAVVSLRPARGEDDNPDTWEEGACRSAGVRHVRVAPRGGDGWLGEMVAEFLAVVDDPANHPALVHCLAGRDRTGSACAAYRMEYDRWAAGRAAAEMGEYGFDPGRDPAARAYERFVLGYCPRWQRVASP